MDHEQILPQELAEDGAVLVLRAPVETVEELKAVRDYVVECLDVGILVLGPGMPYQVERFPPLAGINVKQQPQTPGVFRSRDIPQPATAASAPRKGRASFVEEKANILSRLKAYREANGLGCYGELAKHCRGLSEETVRGLALGEIKLPIEDWRKVGKALEKLESNRGGNGG